MKKFLALYHTHGGHQPLPPMTDAEKGAMMAPWGAWQAKYGDQVVDMGAPLMSMTASMDGSKWGGSESTVSGFSLVSADSLEAAQEMFANHPIYNHPNHSVEICAFVAM